MRAFRFSAYPRPTPSPPPPTPPPRTTAPFLQRTSPRLTTICLPSTRRVRAPRMDANAHCRRPPDYPSALPCL